MTRGEIFAMRENGSEWNGDNCNGGIDRTTEEMARGGGNLSSDEMMRRER